MLKEVIHVSISETDNMSLLDIPSTYVSVDADDAEAIMWVNLFNCLTISELCVRYMGVNSGHLVFSERETISMLRCAGTERAMTRTWIDQCRHWINRLKINRSRVTACSWWTQVSVCLLLDLVAFLDFSFATEVIKLTLPRLVFILSLSLIIASLVHSHDCYNLGAV